jgi:hypothetical protein
MTCAQARPLLSDVAGGELDGARAEAVRAHAAGCAGCGAELSELQAVVALCRKAGGEPLPDGFGLRLHQSLAQAGRPAPASWRVRLGERLRMRPWALAATAAALAACLTLVGGRVLHDAWHRPVAAVLHQVPASKVALVKVDFVAAQEVEDVLFEITLPDGLRFVSGGSELAERSVRFSGRLAAGSNPIPIAVRGPRAGRYKVIAHAVGPELDVTHEVVLEVTT